MNYIIKGTSRCGKTMLTNLIVQKLVGYNKFSTDNFIGAFYSSMPQLKINHESGDGMKELFPNFLKSLPSLTYRQELQHLEVLFLR